MSTLPTDPQPLDEKLCTKCGETKPLTEYYVKIKSTGQRFSWCKACHAVETEVRRKANLPRYCAYAKNRRAANHEESLQREVAYRNKNREALNQRGRERAARPEEKARRAAYREAHDAERKAYNARYREEHAEERKEYQRRYYQENAEEAGERVRRSIAKNPEKYQQIHSDWKKANRDAVRSYGHKRHARTKQNGGSWTAEDWQALKAAYDWHCLMCGRQEMTDGITLCFDHVVPLSLGGFNIVANGQPLCKSCNSKKHRKVLDLRPPAYRT